MTGKNAFIMIKLLRLLMKLDNTPNTSVNDVRIQVVTALESSVATYGSDQRTNRWLEQLNAA
jgi:hypothetical protein